MSDAMVLREDRDGVCILTLNRPDVRNALSADMVRALSEALGMAKKDASVGAVVLTGAGKAFCAGADLAALQKLQGEDVTRNLKDSRVLMKLFRLIRQFPKPVAVAVNGPAIAGGCGLVGVCDYAVSAPAVKYGYPEVKIGFVAALVMVFLKETVGDKMARDMLLSGRLLEAEEALSMGMLNKIAEPDQVLEETVAWARMTLSGSGQAIARTKDLMHRITGETTDRALRLAAKENAKARLTEDCKEGVAAFLEKRKPAFPSRED